MRRLLTLLGVAVAVLVSAPSASADVDLPDPFGCDTVAPMSAPGSGALAIDPGPANPKTGDPFAAKPTVSMYEVYGYAGMDWTNYDLGCGPDALRDPDASIAGAVSNFLWNGLLGTASAVTAIQRWAYAPDTLNVMEPIQRLAADTFGSRIFLPLFGITLAVAGGYIIVRSRSGNVGEGARYAGWALLLAVLAMTCVTWPAKIAPAADDAVTGVVTTVNAAVAGTTTADFSIADATAANTQRGVLYSTWASGVFGRSSGAAVKEYGPQLYRNAALTREEAKLLETDPEKAQKVIEKKKDAYRAAADKLKEADPIAYEHLAGKHNWNRVIAVIVGWLAYLCTMLYTLLASILLLYSLLVVRVAVMLMPLLVVAGAYYPARGIVIRVLDYAAGALFAAVMFGSASAVFNAIAGGVLSPTANIPLLMASLIMLCVTIAGLFLTKPLRSMKSLGAPGLNAFRRNPADTPTATPQQSPTAPPAGESYVRPPTESSVYRHSFARSAVTGVVQGAATGAAFAALTGGASVAAGAATGAARSGAAAATTAATGSPLVGAAVGAGAAHALPSATRALPAGPTGPTAAAAAPAAPAYHPEAPTAAPVPTVVEGVRVWTPGQSNPADALRQAPADQGVYRIFTPQEARR